MTFSEILRVFPKTSWLFFRSLFILCLKLVHVLHAKHEVIPLYKGGIRMNFKKRIIALCLVTAAALSLVFAAPAKQAKHADDGSAILLCDPWEEHDHKYC